MNEGISPINAEMFLMSFLITRDLDTVLNTERDSLIVLLPYKYVPDFLYIVGELLEENKLAVKLDCYSHLEINLDFFFKFHKINILEFYNRLVKYRENLAKLGL